VVDEEAPGAHCLPKLVALAVEVLVFLEITHCRQELPFKALQAVAEQKLTHTLQVVVVVLVKQDSQEPIVTVELEEKVEMELSL
jgi:Holliday junction resolvase-like predicted endonuclease